MPFWFDGPRGDCRATVDAVLAAPTSDRGTGRPPRLVKDPASRSGLGRLAVLLGCGDERLSRDVPDADQLAAGMANRRCEGTGPRVLPDKHGSRAAGLEISADLLDVLQGQHKRQIGLEGPQLAYLTFVVIPQLRYLHGAVLASRDHQEIEHPYRAAVHQLLQLVGHRTREVRLVGRKPDNDIFHGSELVKVDFGHDCP